MTTASKEQKTETLKCLVENPEPEKDQVHSDFQVIKRRYGKENLGALKERTKTMDGTRRYDVKQGAHVKIVLKEDQQSGKLTEGFVGEVLTKSTEHSHGIKVRLETGEVGRIKEMMK